MSEKIKIGIVGYGNLGIGVEKALLFAPDMQLVAIISRRNNISCATPDVPVISPTDIELWQNKIDVLILCGGSSTDLMIQTPYFANYCNTVDSFDTHARICEHFSNVDAVACAAGTVSIISTGWDPGLFSLNRVIAQSVLPDGKDYTFWGPGVSQGHSDAIRRIPGVINARQYTLPINSAVELVRGGEMPEFTNREKHLRDCYVVAEPGADHKHIAETIKNMPDYFSDYETNVTFMDEEDFLSEHVTMPHGGFVFRTGKTSTKHKQMIEFSLKLDSNPEFTGGILVAYARAAYRIEQEGFSGARTVFDVAAKYLSVHTNEELRQNFL